MDICTSCGSRVTESLIDFKFELLEKEYVIKNLEGFVCSECSKEFLSRDMKENIKRIILEESIKFQRQLPIVPILVNKVKKERTDKKISQKIIGIGLGVTEQRGGAIERNETTPTIFTVKQISNLLRLSSDDLYELAFVTGDFFKKLSLMQIKKDSFEIKEDLENLRYELEWENLKHFTIKHHFFSGSKRKIKKTEQEKIERHKKRYNELINKLSKMSNNKIQEELIKQKQITDDKRKTIKEFERKCVLKQDCSIDYEVWIKIKELYKDQIIDIDKLLQVNIEQYMEPSKSAEKLKIYKDNFGKTVRRKNFSIYEEVYNKFVDFCGKYSDIEQEDLLSEAIIEYIDKHNK